MDRRAGPCLGLPGTTPVGSPVTLSAGCSTDPAGGSLAFVWDLDLDGAFDDGTGATVSWTPSHSGTFLVGLRATNGAGRTDVAYGRLHATATNRAPAFTALSPSQSYLKTSMSSLSFSATGTDPDGEPVTVTWSLDGVAQATGPSYPVVLSAGLHQVIARLSDSSPWSVDRTRTWRVLVETGPASAPLGEANPFAIRNAGGRTASDPVSLELTVPSSGPVRIDVIDVGGRHVATLLDEIVPSGTRRLRWDGRDDRGHEAGSGFYLVIARHGGERAWCRTILLR